MFNKSIGQIFLDCKLFSTCIFLQFAALYLRLQMELDKMRVSVPRINVLMFWTSRSKVFWGCPDDWGTFSICVFPDLFAVLRPAMLPSDEGEVSDPKLGYRVVSLECTHFAFSFNSFLWLWLRGFVGFVGLGFDFCTSPV